MSEVNECVCGIGISVFISPGKDFIWRRAEMADDGMTGMADDG